jgi:glutaredoxin
MKRENPMKPKLYNTQRCPYARRTRMVLHEKGVAFSEHKLSKAKVPRASLMKARGRCASSR